MKKAILFILSGGTAALSNLFIFYVLLNILHVWYLLSSIVSFVLSVVVGFYLQKHLTFQNSNKKETKKQAIKFLLVSLINLLINVLLMLLFVEVVMLDKMFAKVCTLSTLACWNYFVYDKLVFNKTS